MSPYDTSGPSLDPRGGLPLAALLQALQGGQPQDGSDISALLANMNTEPPAIETAPQFPSPHAGYLDRLALAFQNLPQQNVGRDQGAGLLQGLAQGFGQARGGAFQARQAETEQQNKQLASQAAAHLANRRWAAQSQAEAYKAIRDVAREQRTANDQALRDKEGTRQFDITSAESKRHNRAMEARPVGGLSGLVGGPEDADNFAEMLTSGQIDWPQVPQRMRAQVARVIKAKGQTVIPKKARDTIQTLTAAQAALNGLQGMLDEIPAAGGIMRFPNGIAEQVQGGLQTPGVGEKVATYNSERGGLLATLSRSTGERGVLTDQDVARARKLVPSIYDAPYVRKDKWTKFRGFLSEIQQRTVKTYTTQGAGLQPERIKYQMDAAGNLVRMP